MRNQTIVIKKQDKMYGGYNFVEFCTATKTLATGSSSAMVGHGNVLISIEASTKKELKDKHQSLIMQGYREVDSLHFSYVERELK